jgi:SP family sugar:H+ symporter-like MFS transporter
MDSFKQQFATESVVNPDGTVSPVFNEWLIGLIVSLLSVGTAIGCLAGAPLADKLGRRKAMFIETIVFDIGVIIQVTSMTAWYQLAIGRLITGLGVGALSSAVWVHLYSNWGE